MRKSIRTGGWSGLALTLMLFGISSAFCQVAPPPPTALPNPLTLPEAIALALRQQPQQFLARTQVTQAQGQKLQAQSQYFPILTPSYQYQNNSQAFYGVSSSGSTATVSTTGTSTTGTSTTGTSATGSTPGGSTAGLTTAGSEVSIVRGGGLTVALSQTLFDTGQREAANAQARRAVDAAVYNSRNTRQTIILTVTQDFYQLLLSRDLVKVAEAQVARYEQAVAVTQAQIDAGTTAAKDIYQAKSDLANAQVTLLNNRNSIQTDSAALKNALGVNLNGVVQIAPLTAGDTLPPPPAPGPALTLEQALMSAFNSRPDLAQQQAILQSNQDAVRLARREAGLSVKGDYILNYQATNDVGTRGTNSQLLLTGSYPLFDAGSARGAVRIAQAARDGAQDQLEIVRQQVRLDVEQAYTTRQANLDAAGLAQSAVDAAQVNYEAAVASRKEGVGTVLDITTAQATLTQAQNQYVTAVYNFYIADAQLQRAIGRNDAALPPLR